MSKDKRYVIHPRNWQVRPPFLPGILLWLFMDRLNSPEWSYGLVGALWLLWFILWVYETVTTEEVDVIQEIKNLKTK